MRLARPLEQPAQVLAYRVVGAAAHPVVAEDLLAARRDDLHRIGQRRQRRRQPRVAAANDRAQDRLAGEHRRLGRRRQLPIPARRRDRGRFDVLLPPRLRLLKRLDRRLQLLRHEPRELCGGFQFADALVRLEVDGSRGDEDLEAGAGLLLPGTVSGDQRHGEPDHPGPALRPVAGVLRRGQPGAALRCQWNTLGGHRRRRRRGVHEPLEEQQPSQHAGGQRRRPRYHRGRSGHRSYRQQGLGAR